MRLASFLPGALLLSVLTSCGGGSSSPNTTPKPGFSSSAPSLTFAGQNVGTSSSTQSFTITNTGTAALSIASITASGDFSQTNNCGASLAPATSCAVQVMFTPAGSGDRTGSLVVNDNAAGAPHSIALAGTGTAPSVQLSSSSLIFGAQVVGTTSSGQAVTLTNNGTATLSIASIILSGDFSQTNNCGATVPAAASCTIDVTFTPTATGTRTGSILVADNAAGAPHSIALTGNGTTPSVQLDSSSLTFGAQVLATTSAVQSVTLTNNGTGVLNVTSIAASGDFGQTNNCGTTVAAAASCTIDVTFTPTATGTRTGSVSVADSASGSPHTISLTGSGVNSVALTINPVTSTITVHQQMQFAANLAVTWTVDGVAGGNVTTGSITPAGLYTPPTTAGMHTVTASGSGMNASANIYVENLAGVYTWHNDQARTGLNSQEIALSPANVNSTKFGKLFSVAVDGYVYAQPLYVANVNIGGGRHNVLYVATEHDSLYAIDADNGTVYWQKSFIDPANGITTLTSTGTTADIPCGDLIPEVGITSTPVIDSATGTIYVLVRMKESGAFFQRLYALDISTSAEKFGGPAVIQPSIAGDGYGSVGGTITFDPLIQNQRAGLALVSGHVVIGWSSHCDTDFNGTYYHGWVVSYNASTLAQEQVWATTPNGQPPGLGYKGSVWMGGAAPAIDSSGHIYFVTSNGGWDGITDFSDTVLKLPQPVASGTWIQSDWFTPWNQLSLTQADLDLGSGGALLLPDLPGGQQFLVTAGKEGTIYLIDRNNMGHFCSGCTTNTNITQEIVGGLGSLFGGPAYFNGTVYLGSPAEDSPADSLKAFSFNANNSGKLSTTPTSMTSSIFNFPGTTPSISSNGNSNGVVWTLDNQTYEQACCQVLYAYDATNLATMLYNSSQAAGSRDTLAAAVKFTVPTVANGKVYVGGQYRVTAFGLLNVP